mgnify:FL=1
MAKWIRTKHRGIRYREHPTRKHGIMPDRYYAIRFADKVAGKIREEAVGWASEGVTETAAFSYLKELKQAARTGEGATSLREKRTQERARREREEIRQLTFGKFFDETYKPWIEANKIENTARTEKWLYSSWIEPVLKNLPLREISAVQVERIKRNMADKGKAPRTIQMALALVRQVFNFAKSRGFFSGDHPVSRVKMPSVDNAKLRYLTPHELDTLLVALRSRSADVADQAEISASCGLRFGEVAGLSWADVNFESKTLAVRDAKTGSRTVFMSPSIEALLRRRDPTRSGGFVFPDKNGKRQERVSKTFQRVADALFNQDVKDRRLRVTFHGLRHSFGSLLYQETGDLYLVQKSLGHKTYAMAQRYAKMSETRLRLAFDTMSRVIENGKKKKESAIISLPERAGADR